MDLYFLIIVATLLLYVLAWGVYRFIASLIIPDTFPEYVRKPKLWQFFLIVFAAGYARKKLDI